MARATFLSDLKVLFDTVFRRWETQALQKLIGTADFEAVASLPRMPVAALSRRAPLQGPLLPRMNAITPAEAETNR